MPRRILAAAGAWFLAAICLISCHTQEKEPAFFTLNGAERDIVVGLGPDAQELSFTLESNGGWELSPLAADSTWVRVRHERTGTTNWTFRLNIAELSASLVFHSAGQTRKYTVQQEPPSSFFWRRQIGAYGVKGGDCLYDPARHQLSWLHYPGGTSLRILEPATAKVSTLSGLPEKLEAGQEFTIHYRVCEKGLVTVSESYPGVRVLRVTPSLVWLRKSDNIYFIVMP